MGEVLRVLIIGEKPTDGDLAVRALWREGFEPEWRRVETEAAYLQCLVPGLDLILSDDEMPHLCTSRALHLLRERGLDIPFIIVSGTTGEETAVAAMKEGADDYLAKDRLAGLGAAVRRALEERRQRQRQTHAGDEVQRFISASPAVTYAWAVNDGVVEPLWMSDNVTRLTGHDRQEALSKTWWPENIHPDDRARVLAGHPMPQGVDHVMLEYRFRRKDGRWAWVRDEKRLSRDPAGRPLEVVGSWVDVTDRKQGEHREALRHAVARVLARSASLKAAAAGIVQAVCESLGGEFGAIWEMDPQTKSLRCVDVWRLPGLPAEDLENQTRRLTFAPGVGLPGRILASRTPLVLTDLEDDFPRAELATKAGLRGAFGLPILQGGEVTGVLDVLRRQPLETDRGLLDTLLGIGTQISQFIEHRLAEQQLLQAGRMEAVGQLAGGIAHDFNTLLGVIIGYAELAARDLGPEHKTNPRIEAIRQAAERAAALTRQILTFSGRQAVEARECDINRILEDMQPMLRRLVGEDVQLAVALGEHLGRVRADHSQIEEVITNLAVNAREAMPSGGKLVIATSNVDLDDAYARSHPEVHPGPHVMLVVGDTGDGMEAGTLARIFEPFFTMKGPGKGSGLGLAVVFGVVKQSGGSLSVHSEPGRGSTFKIYLPRVEEKASTVLTTRSVAEGGSETVLLVEDEDGLRAVVAETLRDVGYTVLEARNPRAAAAVAAESAQEIHLMITDVVLSGESGAETASQLRNARPDLRVLLMSGYADRMLNGPRTAEPGAPFLSKPFTIDLMLRKVREVLDASP